MTTVLHRVSNSCTNVKRRWIGMWYVNRTEIPKVPVMKLKRVTEWKETWIILRWSKFKIDLRWEGGFGFYKRKKLRREYEHKEKTPSFSIQVENKGLNLLNSHEIVHLDLCISLHCKIENIFQNINRFLTNGIGKYLLFFWKTSRCQK